METFSEKLSDALASSKKKLIEVSRDTGIPKGTLSRYKNGHRVPKITDAKKIADSLGITLEDLV